MLCRFIHQYNSRSPLGCSREQLEHVLTHYQVMAPFLEHVFTFHRREDPYLQASFRAEDYVWGQHPKPNFEGSRIQHCFNLVGLEYDYNSRSKSGTFKYRQTAAYFSFDLVSGQTIWLVLKGNKVVRQSVEELGKDLFKDPDWATRMQSKEGAFSLALRSHLLICEWAIETWTPYINSLQAQHVDMSNAVTYTPVTKKTEDAIMDHTVSRNTTFNSKLQGDPAVQRRQIRTKSWDKMMEALGRQAGEGSKDSSSPPTLANESQDFRPDIGHIFPFDKLQKLHLEATCVQEGLSVLGQNKSVLQDMLKRFQQLNDCEQFLPDAEISQENFQKFVSKIEYCIGELETQRKRLSAIQGDLERTISMVSLEKPKHLRQLFCLTIYISVQWNTSAL